VSTAASSEAQDQDVSDSLKQQIKQALVTSLRLPMSPDDIQDDAPLFGEGLGLDSVDALELVLEIERRFGVAIADEQTGTAVLRSINSIADHITAARSASA
jgi:acyl carrier protein